MKKHSDSIVLPSGLPANGATVTVYEAGTTNLASIYSTALGTALSNPITADSVGYFEFYAADGVYSIAVSGLGYQTNTSTVVLYTDPAETAYTTATFTNKTIDLSNNTLTGTIAQFNAACSDADFVTGSGTVSGTNTGDQTITLTGDATGSGTGSFAVTVGKVNGVSFAGLATGILKNTTTTGAPSIAVSGTDYQAPIGTISGLVKGNGANSLTAATVRTDYAEPTTALATGILKNTTSTGAHTIATAGTDYSVPTGTETLTNKTIEAGTFTNGYTEEVATANTSTAYTIDLANGSVQILTLTGNCTYTFPTPTAGKGFTLLQKQDGTGSRTVTWPSSVKWPSSTAPTLTSTASKGDKITFVADGTYWWGSVAGLNYL